MEKIENGQNILNTIETDIPRNLAKDFDEEMDDIFTKLGTLSPNSSFDSTILNNRNKTFFNDFHLDIPQPIRRNTTNKILKIKTNNIEKRTKNIDIDEKNYSESINYRKNKTTMNNSKKYSKNEVIKTHDKLKSSDNLYRNLNRNYNYNENINNNLPIINENTKNIKDKENEKIINEKIECIIYMIKEMKEINKKLKNKDLKK